jgi:hypothetical protein
MPYPVRQTIRQAMTVSIAKVLYQPLKVPTLESKFRLEQGLTEFPMRSNNGELTPTVADEMKIMDSGAIIQTVDEGMHDIFQNIGHRHASRILSIAMGI